MMNSRVLPKGHKTLLNAWAFYDWANSVYSLTIVSAVFPIFYGSLFTKNELITVFGYAIRSTPLITYATAIGFLIVAITSPILSGIADYIGNKKVFMKFFNYLGAFSCIALFWFSKEHIYFSLTFYILALVGYWGSIVFYNSYLPDIAHLEQQDKISAKGYSLGYIGSVILLLINLAMVMTAVTDTARIDAMKLSFIMVGVWWIAFSQFSYYYLPKGNKGHSLDRSVLFKGFKELNAVRKGLTANIPLKRYLIAFFVYSMAVQTVMLVATYFGEQEIDWGGDGNKTMGLIVSILLIQIVAVGGAILTSRCSKRFGNITTLIGINVIWLGVCVYAYFVETSMQFYVTAGVVGLIMGGIQALSRSTYSKYLPETEDTTSYFSFYDVAEKIGIIIGMGIYATVDLITGSMRSAVIFLGIFFILGIIGLLRVPRLELVAEKN
ncbi:UMF1 family MFS transporter [Aquimarina intermedia]|uniref:UMF1 family MFS transporter n=2 Tax=Aquimarina intermedia TaxID=350814 RepID=A0A5S5C9E4_9FLAO|nr:MFS transporter [Aquimarina intermedia]TYP75238.1 UMF1 family MFS transporter [Aquimarina intermedia]